MIRNILILIGLFVFTLASSGCRAGGVQALTQGFKVSSNPFLVAMLNKLPVVFLT